MKITNRETNAKFSKGSLFKKTCELAEIPATTRQASKYRRGLGIAIKFKQRAFGSTAQEYIKEIFSKRR